MQIRGNIDRQRADNDDNDEKGGEGEGTDPEIEKGICEVMSMSCFTNIPSLQ